ncbi:leucine-rich repeat and death domain-containing protein 1-like isoform X2 [Mercenaria mercenaria]|nr:leucine-rich repeat and death domain-containing protein 1-like isoform X2 [Mercenaria mercenaria]
MIRITQIICVALMLSPTVVSSEYFGYSECVYNKYKAVCLGEFEAVSYENRGLTKFPSISRRKTCVHLQHNHIERFPEDLSSLSHVVTLGMADNRISSLPDDLEKMVKLEILDVSENRLKMLSPSTRFPASLRGLLLARNEMKTIPAGVTVPGLFVLDLSNNVFTDIPEHFCVSGQLIRVDFTDNRLRHEVSQYIDTVNRCRNVNEIPFCLFTDKTNIKCDCSSMGPILGGSPSFCMGTPQKSLEIECSAESEEMYLYKGQSRGQKVFDVNVTMVKDACPKYFTESGAGQKKSEARIVRYSEIVLITLFLSFMCL